MSDKDELEFEAILVELNRTRETQTNRGLTVEIDQLHAAGAQITELMLAAQELAQPNPQYFTRG